ncbi:DNA polymerase alpha catalytic subunit [Cynara cardunculus var. scolymus]|uniref:DNA polymerase alpha catalytic subunit n=1 Tax=Cynara cardunculus var. scolymus TaxID=59895 RepID=UPI000D6289B9|nr:DNA polymerase alpha catalytic subunit [Cynara cardunculus var. scolymus]
MEDDQQRPKRNTKGADSEKRAEALRKINIRRQGGGGDNGIDRYQIKIDEPIYDTVDEDEYQALVANRREDFKGFIVDDDGLGYGDEGEEVDWTQSGVVPSSEEESEGELERKKRKKTKTEKEKKEHKKPSFEAAAALMGKQRISNLFTSAVFNKSKPAMVSSDSIVDDVIAEFAPDENDKEKRRRGNKRLSENDKILAPTSLITSVKAEKAPASLVVGSTLLSNSLHKHDVLEEEKELLEIPNNGKDLGVVEEPAVVPSQVEELMDEELKVEPMVNRADTWTLNAKIKEEKDPTFSATAGLQIIENSCLIADIGPGLNSDEKPPFVVDSDGSLPFYVLDAYEEFSGSNAGNIYLFGKVKAGITYHSCCVVVKNMQRCIYAIPNGPVFEDSAIVKLVRDVEESKVSSTAFHTKLHEMAFGLKANITKELLDRNVSNFSMKPVKRNYAFERSDIERKENYVLKISYPFKDPPLPSDLKGETFCALLGTHSSALELFLIKRKIKGPSWLSISKFSSCTTAQRVSWCKFEVTVDCPKDIQVATSSKNTSEIPPVVVTAINLKTIINQKQNTNEIASASVICCHKAKIDTPMLASEWTRPGMLSHFTVVRKLEDGLFPMGFSKEAADRNLKAGSNIISMESSERALLNRLMIELHKLDSDVLVGHNISGFDLDVLLNRVKACKVPNSMWSKIGRLKRSEMPRLNKGSTVFGSGASPGIMSCIAGRLLCDTFLCARDLLKEVSYSLTELAKTQLSKNRKEVAPHDVPRLFQSSQTLMELIEIGETDAWLSMELMFHLSVLPLTRQLTNISGNLWGKTLQGARAQRVEYLLLHAFHAKKFMVPDKSYLPKEGKTVKRKSDGLEDKVINDLGVNDEIQSEPVKSKKAPAYAGGLVLEPKRGLYDKYILLLDFNSLYPSIIQEYNICFTTVERSQDDLLPRLPSSKATGVLPELLKNLVERRKHVKKLLKTATGLKLQQFDIQQQALKLTANSMYGCLGFSNSRFYAKPLAELITLQGREILQSTVDLVQNNLNLEVIYGDTDSIMIYTGLDDISKAKSIAGNVIKEVNKRYKRLEIDLDGLYKRMLLLKKKKYAAVKEQIRDGKVYKVIERKGLDMVRRDWSLLSKETGDFCLGQILSELSCEEVVESIHNKLRKVQEDMRNGEIGLEKYIITKTLTKPPEAYPDARSQPHVEVALRLRKLGYTSGCSAGDTVPYIVCCEQGKGSSTSAGIAQRARHPDELTKDNENLMIDIDYYLAQQIHPVVSRLCASIEGTSPACLADCLGLDPSKFQSKSSEVANNDHSGSVLCMTDDEERYRGCEALSLSCPGCSATFECTSVLSYIRTATNLEKPADLASNTSFWHKLSCPKCQLEVPPPSIANQVKRLAESFISTYYKGLMTCDDETCDYTTRSLNLRVVGDSERGTICPNYPRCNGRLVRQYSEADVYKQLSYFCYLLDAARCIDKVDGKLRASVEKEVARITPLVELASLTVHKVRDRCDYGWVKLNDLF